MNRRKFVQTAAGFVAVSGVGSVSGEIKGDPIVTELEIREQISDGERGAMLAIGEVQRLPQEFLQVEVLMQYRDGCGEIVIEMQEALEDDRKEQWSFTQSWFAESDRIEAVEEITAIINVHYD